jgi:hypothetical protein
VTVIAWFYNGRAGAYGNNETGLSVLKLHKVSLLKGASIEISIAYADVEL